ncbi:MAG: HAMP domain-containing histidine kinase [Gammaproteobacteria bacterium]|nr:HAMP domain-containing histidine kinase [Gammaproteobacteria bacterium]
MTRGGIRARLGRLFVLQISVISVAVIAAVFATAYIVTDVLSRAALEGEAAYFWKRYASDASVPLPDTDNMIAYLAPGGALEKIPAALAERQPGFGQLDFEGRDSLLYVSDGPAGRLYLVFRQEQVSRLILYFGVIPAAFVLLLIYALSYIVYVLSQRAVSPLVRLAGRLEDYRPADRSYGALRLDDLREDADDETLTMVGALEDFAARLEDFALREREFTRDASHELRTPIAVLAASLDLLERNGARPPAEQQVLARMRKAVLHMQSLLENLLLLAHEDPLPVPPEGADINALVAEQIELLRDRTDETGNSVHLEECAQVQLPVPQRLFSVAFGNLLANALNYTRNGDVRVRIDSDVVAVEDTGVGMTADDVQRAFEPFFRGDHGAAEGAPGHGLGLAIVQRIARRCGWQVELASEPGRGTRASLVFRRADAT